MDGRKLLIGKPLGLAAGAAGGAAFKTIWRRVDAGRDVPRAQDEGRSWRAVLIAAALQGAIFAVIHAVVDRATRPHPAEAETELVAEDRATTGRAKKGRAKAGKRT